MKKNNSGAKRLKCIRGTFYALVDWTWISFSFLLETYYIRGDHNVGCVQHAADTRHWCSSRKVPEKNNIHVGICSFCLLGSSYYIICTICRALI